MGAIAAGDVFGTILFWFLNAVLLAFFATSPVLVFTKEKLPSGGYSISPQIAGGLLFVLSLAGLAGLNW